MKQLPLLFVSGLPRSGSTLLMNLLGQNPNFHVTPTNDLLEIITTVRDSWTNMISFKSQGIETVKPRILSSLKGSIYGFFENEFDEGKVVFDKSRGWLANIELIEEILGREVKIIVTVRDIRAIVSSFEKINRKSQVTKPMPGGQAYFDYQTIEGRAAQLLHQESVLGLSINRIRDVFNRGLSDRLIIMPYHKLTTETQNVMNDLHTLLGFPEFEYTPDNVEQVTHEDDSVHGMKLHEIRKEIKPVEPDWEQVLTPDLCDKILNEYRDLIDLANS